jgi:dihydrolipoamide dehydrogenase
MVVGEFTTKVDLIVIGAGPGGYVAAIRAAQLGKQVTVIEKGALGGVCLNRGCIPSKALISAAHQYQTMLHSELRGMGIVAKEVSVDFPKVQAWKNSIVDKLDKGISSLFKQHKIEVVTGEAMFSGSHELRVVKGYETMRYQFNECIIATGSKPIELNTFPFGNRILSSTEALSLSEIPQRLVVIGGGYIGIELGQAFSKLGSKVTILEGGERILPYFEATLVQPLIKQVQKEGLSLVTSAVAKSYEETDEGIRITFAKNKQLETIEADYLLVTVGRTPDASALDLHSAGIEVDKQGFILINKQCRTSASHIYAIGDIVKGPALAHKASYEGKIAAEVIAGLPSEIDYKTIPSIVYTEPEIASVGLSEEQARQQYRDVVIGKYYYKANGRALTIQAEEGYVKIVANKENALVLGAQIIGAHASNLIAELGFAIEMSATLEDIALTIHAHPSFGEMTMEAAEDALRQGVNRFEVIT